MSHPDPHTPPPSPPCAPPPGGGIRPPAELPTPSAEEVSRFRSLFRARFGVELSEEQADDQARRLVQFVFLTQHALPRIRDIRDQQAEQEQRAAEATDGET